MSNVEKKMQNIPVLIAGIYILVTFMISVFGPMKYVNYEAGRVALFLGLVILSFTGGYLLAHKHPIVLRKTHHKTNKPWKLMREQDRVLRFVKVSIIIALLVAIGEFLFLLRLNPGLLNIRSIGANYASSRNALNETGYSPAIILRFLTAFFRNVSIILGMYYFKSLSRKFKCLYGCFFVILIWGNVVGYGTQKVMGDILVYAIIIAVIKMLDMSKRKRQKIYLTCICAVLAGLVIFTIMQAGRAQSIGLTAENFASRSDGLAYYDTDHIIFKLFGKKYGFGLAAILTSYLSSGYYGLSLCLQLPFVWCKGVGNSYALSSFMNRFLGWDNMYYQSYLYRMEESYGRNGLRSWNTIFPWLASDFSFVGVIILMFFVGYIWSVAWDEVLKYRNPVAVLLFANIGLGVVFAPANNQLFNGIDGCISTIFVILYWLVNHRRLNREVNQDDSVKNI